ncbi:MAG: DUF4445 domain-containing protein [bacterium]|nr:DUF4445 domain-containing protein [bacterium]
MPRVEFKPYGKIVDVPAGTELVDAARTAGVPLDLPCGGKGTCNKCLVHVAKGTLEHERSGDIENLPENHVRACRSRITGSDLVIDVPLYHTLDEDRYENTDEYSLSIEKHLGEKARSPLSARSELSIPAAVADDGLSDFDRITRELKRVRPDLDNLETPLSIIRSLPHTLRSKHGALTAVVSGDPAHLIGIQAGHGEKKNFGIAVDLGTTTISTMLISLTDGKILAARTGYNEQVSCGLDIISRINYAGKSERLEDLRRKALGVINRMIGDMTKDYPVSKNDITAAVISGNTVMTHLLLGVEPEYLRLHPYSPALLSVPSFSAGEIGIEIHPLSGVHISPAVGSYVGGDITAGILCTTLAAASEEICLFIDIGTNGEIVLGSKDFLMTCACSAGPAFEGGEIECGMRATEGAINKISVNPETGVAQYSTIGDVPPKGICGSGIIDLLAQLFLQGLLDNSGKLNRDKGSPAVRIEGRRAVYEIASSEAAAAGRAITISETDIENILRAKAAIYSGAALLLQHVGIDFSDLAAVYVAGGFGKYLNLENSVTLGLLPDLPREKFRYIGNSSLTGSALLLLSGEYRQLQKDLAQGMTYVNLGNEPAYMDQYTAALFIPHTDFSRFPSIKQG